MSVTIKDLYEARYEPDKCVILIERLYKNSLVEGQKPTTNKASLKLAIRNYLGQFEDSSEFGAAEKLLSKVLANYQA